MTIKDFLDFLEKIKKEIGCDNLIIYCENDKTVIRCQWLGSNTFNYSRAFKKHDIDDCKEVVLPIVLEAFICEARFMWEAENDETKLDTRP